MLKISLSLAIVISWNLSYTPVMQTRLHHSALITLLVLPVAAQQGAAIFHHFHHYPTGQYTTRTEGTVTGGPPGQPNTQTVCISAPSPAQISAFVQMEKESPVLRSCTMRIVRDEEKTAEYEQTCPHGKEGTLVTHMTMSAIDDRTFKTDTLAKSGTYEFATHSNTHYDGPCTAAQLAEASHAQKPSPKECAEFVESQKELGNSCKDAPAAYRATCEKNLQAVNASAKQMLAACAN